MKEFNLIDEIHTAVAVIGKDMRVVEANKAFQQRFNLDLDNIIGGHCYKAAYLFDHKCNHKKSGNCPVGESFKTKKIATAIHHNWINNQAIVEEVTTTPIIDENGDINYVVEEFRDVTQLLGLNKGIIGICSYCRKLRDEDGRWVSFEAYFHKHTGANFSHGICEECNDNLLTTSDDNNGCPH